MGRPRPLRAIRAGGAGWWYSEPDEDADRPQAQAYVGTPELEAMARLGAADPVDYVWVEGDVLYAAPAYGGIAGEDKDGDGVATPEDCDDTEATVFPGAIDLNDGLDNNCDGAVDERGPDLLAAVTGDAGDRAGKEIVAWRGPDGDRVVWVGDLGLQVASLVPGTLQTLLDGPEQDLVAGDFDGDGADELIVGSIGTWARSYDGAVFAYRVP